MFATSLMLRITKFLMRKQTIIIGWTIGNRYNVVKRQMTFKSISPYRDILISRDFNQR